MRCFQLLILDIVVAMLLDCAYVVIVHAYMYCAVVMIWLFAAWLGSCFCACFVVHPYVFLNINNFTFS